MTTALSDAQALFHRLVTAPESVEPTLAALAISREAVERTFAGDGRLSVVERLDVYADAYFFRIRDALKEQFERTTRALGDDAFHDLVVDYLVAHPPETPSLRDVGERLGRFVEMHPLSTERPYLADLVRFEWLLLEAFDAADAPALARASLASTQPDQFGSIPLALHPSVRLLRSRFGVDEPDVRVDPCTLLVWRAGGDTRFRRVDALELAALEMVRGGARFAEVCELVADRIGDDVAPRRALELLLRWLDDAMLVAP